MGDLFVLSSSLWSQLCTAAKVCILLYSGTASDRYQILASCLRKVIRPSQREP